MKQEFEELKAGETLRKGDEYSSMTNVWRTIPEFMQGDIIPENDHVKWRRLVLITDHEHKKKWFKK